MLLRSQMITVIEYPIHVKSPLMFSNDKPVTRPISVAITRKILKEGIV